MLTMPQPRTFWPPSWPEAMDTAWRYMRSGQYSDAFREYIQAARVAPNRHAEEFALEQAAFCERLAEHLGME
jgi:hypothetical protein